MGKCFAHVVIQIERQVTAPLTAISYNITLSVIKARLAVKILRRTDVAVSVSYILSPLFYPPWL